MICFHMQSVFSWPRLNSATAMHCTESARSRIPYIYHIHYSIDNTHQILHSVASLFYFFFRLHRITKKCIAQQQQQKRWLQLRRHCYIKKNQWIPIVWMYSMPMFSDTFVALFFHIGHFSKFICISQTCSMFLDES